VLGSVFAPVPGAGHWRTALLLDGNIGIGGHPASLLARLRSLLRADGSVLCELDPPGTATGAQLVALEEARGVRSSWFAWARVSVDGLVPLARSAHMTVGETWCDEGRWFALLTSVHQTVSNSSSTARA
jgi:hypothetical protein